MNTKTRDGGTDGDDVIGSDVVLSLNPRVTMTGGGDDSSRIHTPSVSTTLGGGIALSTLRSEERELLGLADGRRSVDEMIRLSTISPQSVRKHLRALRDRGILIQKTHPGDSGPHKDDLDIPDPADLNQEDSGDGSTALTRAIDEYLELAASALNNAAALEESSRPTVAMAVFGEDVTDKLAPPSDAAAASTAASPAESERVSNATTSAGLGSVPTVEQPVGKSPSHGMKSNVTQFWIPSMAELVAGVPGQLKDADSSRAASAPVEETSPVDSELSAAPQPSSGPTVVVAGSRPTVGAPAVPAEIPRAQVGPVGQPLASVASPRPPAASHPPGVAAGAASSPTGGGPVGPAPQPGASPFRVGGYEVATRIAQGGMGSIYVCRRAGESGFQRLFTLKVVRQHSSQREEAVQSFKREAHIGSLLNHPNLQTVLDVGSYKDQPFLVLDYVEGTSLSDLLSDDRRAPVPLIVAVLLDILRGLEHAHELVDDKGTRLGLVHGDVSPHNVLVGVDGAARLTDFGSATFTGEGRAHDPKWVATGKPAYMAPEQLRAEPLDARTDVFAVGILMWSALTGQKLFSGETYDETIMKVLKKKIPAPSAFGAPAFLDDVCLKALSRAREGRYATAEEMARDLQRVAAPESAIAPMTEVGQWVRRESGEALSEQRRRIQLMFGSSKASPGGVHTPGPTRSAAPTVVMHVRKDFQTPQVGDNKAVPSRTVFLPAVQKPRTSKTFWQTWKVVIVSALLALPVTLTIGFVISNLWVAQPQPPLSPPPFNLDAASPH